jgi:hypothetical protein
MKEQKIFIAGVVVGALAAGIFALVVLDTQSREAATRLLMSQNNVALQTNALSVCRQEAAAKSAGATMIYEPGAAASIPVLNGIAGVTIAPNSTQRPAFVVVGRVQVFGAAPGAEYRWLDAQGREQGRFPVQMPVAQ